MDVQWCIPDLTVIDTTPEDDEAALSDVRSRCERTSRLMRRRVQIPTHDVESQKSTLFGPCA